MGCMSSAAPETSYVKIVPTATQYVIGDTVVVTLENSGGDKIWYCQCRTKLQLLRDGGWADAGTGGDACMNAATTLEAGATVSWRIGNIPQGAHAGTYRYLLRDLWSADGTPLPDTWRSTTPFTVGSP